MEEKPNRGAMFTRQKRSDNHPDFGGDFTLGGDVLDYIIRCAENRETPKLRISAWKKQTARGGVMMSLQIQLDNQDGQYQPRQGNRVNEERPRGFARTYGDQKSDGENRRFRDDDRYGQGYDQRDARDNTRRDDYRDQRSYDRGSSRGGRYD